jgi:hypothetical protein
MGAKNSKFKKDDVCVVVNDPRLPTNTLAFIVEGTPIQVWPTFDDNKDIWKDKNAFRLPAIMDYVNRGCPSEGVESYYGKIGSRDIVISEKFLRLLDQNEKVQEGLVMTK